MARNLTRFGVIRDRERSRIRRNSPTEPIPRILANSATDNSGATSRLALWLVYSDDHGDAWNRGPIVVRSGDPATHPMEGVVAQLSDGRVMMNILTSYYDPVAISLTSFDLRQWLPTIPGRRDNE